ncbi:MAG TPA: response regulator [Telluria sp.]|nr:response regulator [Telluria sp.]
MLETNDILHARILIVDDQEANVLLLEQMLHNSGYRNVTSTQDPRSVGALYRAQRFDLVLLDLQMPEMDGFEVLAELKDIETDYLPVLVITAQPGHKLRALSAGAKDFVSKPFDLVEVQTRIHNMLEVRLLYRKLNEHNAILEQTVLARTAELRASEARFQRFAELSSDWYWEQDADGKLTQSSGPVGELLGAGLFDANVVERKPFLDLICKRRDAQGVMRYLQVSGEPTFDVASRFTGYRGIGIDVTAVYELARAQPA